MPGARGAFLGTLCFFGGHAKEEPANFTMQGWAKLQGNNILTEAQTKKKVTVEVSEADWQKNAADV